ncbi:MAG: sugar ABC transporter ATP-binding protein [Ignisphaera sp.]|uniref:Sugar ABC transporter ATP-binding protein n=1 Tax=Ignisphaera aggregans TaxID=334771 RepID=A0A7C4JKB7_9CREN
MGKNLAILAKNIVKKFPGVIALNNVNFDAAYGEIHGLLGQNGAGKSTLLKIIYGIHKPERGELYINNVKTSMKSPRDARKHGIVLVHQEITVIPHLTVLENIALLGFTWNTLMSKFSWRDFRMSIEDLLSKFDIDLDLSAKVRNLGAAERMIVQIVSALSINAKILLLDEPTSPLSLHEIERLFSVLNQLKKNNIAMVFVTHRVNEALEICDRITVLRNGEKIATIESKSIDTHELIKLMLGREPEELYRFRIEGEAKLLLEKYSMTTPLIELVNISTKPSSPNEIPLKNINLKVYPGEVVAVFGFVGAGKTELGKTIIGLTEITSGYFKYMGRTVKIKSPVHALRYGIYYLPEDRRVEGLIPHFTVASNMTISSLHQFAKAGTVLDLSKEVSVANNMVKILNIVTPSPLAKILQLSGGNQQKVLVARAMLSNAKIVVFDEPTVGIDVGAKAEIRRLIYRYSREKGVSSLVLTSDVDEALGIADRIYVIKDGVIVKEFINERLDRDEVIKVLA